MEVYLLFQHQSQAVLIYFVNIFWAAINWSTFFHYITVANQFYLVIPQKKITDFLTRYFLFENAVPRIISPVYLCKNCVFKFTNCSALNALSVGV